MPYCEECGNSMSNRAKFCSQCGRPVGEYITTVQQRSVPESGEQVQTVIDTPLVTKSIDGAVFNRSFNWIVLASAFSFVFIALGGLVWFLNNEKSSSISHQESNLKALQIAETEKPTVAIARPVMQKKQEIAQLEKVKSFVDCTTHPASISPNGAMMFYCYKVIDSTTGQKTNMIGSDLKSVSFSRDSKFLYASFNDDRDGGIKVFDLTTKPIKLTKKLIITNMAPSYMNPNYAMATSPDGKLIAYGSWNYAVVVSVESWKMVGLLKHDSGYVRKLSFSADGSKLAVIASDNEIEVWDPNKGRKLSKLTVSGWNKAKSIAFSPTQDILVGTGDDKQIIIWDTISWRQRKPISIQFSAENLSFSEDGKFLSAAIRNNNSDEGYVEVYEISSGNRIARSKKQTCLIDSVAFGPGNLLVSGCGITGEAYSDPLTLWRLK